MHQISELSLFSGPANCSAWEATPSQQFSQFLLLQWYMFSYQTPASSFNELTLFNKLPKSSPLK